MQKYALPTFLMACQPEDLNLGLPRGSERCAPAGARRRRGEAAGRAGARGARTPRRGGDTHESWNRCNQVSGAGWEPEPRVLSRGAVTSQKKRQVMRPEPTRFRGWKERAVGGQPLMAEPDFGTGKNVVLPFPSAQGRTLSFFRSERRPKAGVSRKNGVLSG